MDLYRDSWAAVKQENEENQKIVKLPLRARTW